MMNETYPSGVKIALPFGGFLWLPSDDLNGPRGQLPTPRQLFRCILRKSQYGVDEQCSNSDGNDAHHIFLPKGHAGR